MIELRKTALELLRKKRKKKGNKKKLSVKEKKIINTYKFSKKNNLQVYYKNIDYLTIELTKGNFANLLQEELLKPLNHKQVTKNKQDLPYCLAYSGDFKIIFDKFFFVYSGSTYANKKRIYSLYDFSGNKLGQIVLSENEEAELDVNVKNIIELSGLFFKCYKSYLDDFFTLLNIDKSEQGVIRRLDYCVDFKGLEVFEILEYANEKIKKTKDYINGLTYTDIKDLLKTNEREVKYGKQPVSLTLYGARQDFKVYDKILRVIQEFKYNTVDGKNPYEDYLKSDAPIFRIEVKRKADSMRDLKDNSINYFFENIEALYFEYIKRYLDIDLSYFVKNLKKVDRRKNFLAQEVKYRKLDHTLKMFKAYGNSLKFWGGDNFLKKKFVDIFPEADKIGYLEALPKDMLEDFFLMPKGENCKDFLEKDFMYMDTSDKLIINN